MSTNKKNFISGNYPENRLTCDILTTAVSCYFIEDNPYTMK